MVILSEDRTLSSFITLEFEPVGKWFELYNFQKHQGDVFFEEEEESSSGSEEEEEEDSPDYVEFLKTLDPKEWKDQDHYKVLGLDKLRYKATQNQIKKAHKKKVLKYHPDKQKQSGQGASAEEREFFTCITKAFEILSDPVKRRAFDSVDPTFDDDIPSTSENSKKNFFKLFGDAFEKNSRWSMKKPVPQLGDDNSTFDEVNSFYAFWFDFSSWREYSYLDEENKESAQDRYERREIEKQNKNVRNKRKKDENARLRQLVDNAYACDPRIIKFKNEEKRKKEEVKNKRQEEKRQREEEEKRKLEEARLAKEKQEEEERLKLEAEKKEKDQYKKALKKERKTIRTIIKNQNYFATNEEERVKLMDEIEKLVDLLTLNEIQPLNEELQKNEQNQSVLKELVFKMVDNMNERLEEQRQQELSKMTESESKSASASAKAEASAVSSEWTDEEIRLLVKGAKVIPVGTRDRWDVIANFIEEHSRGKFKRTGKEVLAKTKELQKDTSAKEEFNKKAYEKTLQTIKTDATVQDKPSERYGTPAEQLVAEQGSNPAPWSPQEQKTLEQALKTYPSTLADRWEKIAECIPTRSKKDCMVRYKELVELIQAKKKAQTKAQ